MPMPEWEQFEIAVANFVSALDPNAHVQHDARLPDLHTGLPRQRDVWVETKLLGHFPVRVLISCKREKRRLNQQDVDAFNGEKLSSGAHLGVIYSYSGFGEAAIEKAKRLGICCCRLYQDDPPELPDRFCLMGYCLRPRVGISLKARPHPQSEFKTWDDLFCARFPDQEGSSTVLDAILEAYWEVERTALGQISPSQVLPVPHVCELELDDTLAGAERLRIQVAVSWRCYRGRLEACLLKGSYCVTAGEFIGSQTLPSIDLRGEGPGPGWELMPELPARLESNAVLCILSGATSKQPFLEALGPQELCAAKLTATKPGGLGGDSV